MPIATTDLVAYAALNMPTDDASVSGGGIDVERRVVFTDIAGGNGTIELLSDGADTRTFTITGRLASGAYVSEGPTALNGATPVTTSNTFERVLSVNLASTSATRTVTVRKASDDVLIGTIPVNEKGFMRMFRNALGEPTGGSSRIYHEKFFWRNNNGSLALLDAKVSESADPSTDVTFALEDAVSDTGQVSNRLNAPAAGDIGASGFVNTPTVLDMGTETDATTQDLAAGAAIGVWLKLTVPVNEAPYAAANRTYTSQISGASI